jgi:phosphoglycolate phosphatase-like HAD superfamily hydrolase
MLMWESWVFDCDGVILDSNKVKSEAMFRAALPYGVENAKLLVEYHVRNGGVSREIKFRWFLCEVMAMHDDLESAIDELKHEYGKNLWSGLLNCDEATGLRELTTKLKAEGVSLFVISGADQDELRAIFDVRGLDSMFDGIYGAPESKDEIIAREIGAGTLRLPAVFLGDSRYDHVAATNAGLNFIFISQWTEFGSWREYCTARSIPVAAALSDLLR